MGKMATEQVQPGYKEKLFPHEDSQKVKQIYLRVCAIPAPGGFCDPSIHSPEQRGLTSALSRGLEQRPPRTNLNYSMIL